MLTLEQLNALRGIKSNSGSSADKKTQVSSAQGVATETVEITKNNTAPKVEYPDPIDIPCKNYTDEKGHFAYIDANTHQISHVNLDSGKTYTWDDVYALSLQHAVEPLSEEAHKLQWQQVLNEDTVFDRFGSPLFSFDEIQNAVEKAQNTSDVEPIASEEKANDKPKQDPFGLSMPE